MVPGLVERAGRAREEQRQALIAEVIREAAWRESGVIPSGARLRRKLWELAKESSRMIGQILKRWRPASGAITRPRIHAANNQGTASGRPYARAPHPTVDA